MLNIAKCGQNDFGIWVYGTLQYDGLEIRDIFRTNLLEIPKDTKLKIKKLIIKRTKNNDIRFSIEF